MTEVYSFLYVTKISPRGESVRVTIRPSFQVPNARSLHHNVCSPFMLSLPCEVSSNPLNVRVESLLMVMTFCFSISPICFTSSGVVRCSSNCTLTFSTVQVPMRLSLRWQAERTKARPVRKRRLFFIAFKFEAKVSFFIFATVKTMVLCQNKHSNGSK